MADLPDVATTAAVVAAIAAVASTIVAIVSFRVSKDALKVSAAAAKAARQAYITMSPVSEQIHINWNNPPKSIRFPTVTAPDGETVRWKVANHSSGFATNVNVHWEIYNPLNVKTASVGEGTNDYFFAAALKPYFGLWWAFSGQMPEHPYVTSAKRGLISLGVPNSSEMVELPAEILPTLIAHAFVRNGFARSSIMEELWKDPNQFPWARLTVWCSWTGVGGELMSSDKQDYDLRLIKTVNHSTGKPVEDPLHRKARSGPALVEYQRMPWKKVSQVVQLALAEEVPPAQS